MRGEEGDEEQEGEAEDAEALAMEEEYEDAGGFEYQMRRDSGGNDSRIGNPDDYSY
jgi:hypothetical protein